MPFQMKSQVEIYNDLESYVAAFSDITDFNVGSVVRTILEAAALNDAELYLQLAFVKALQSLDLTAGDDLDERAVEYGVTRLAATSSVGSVQFGDRNVTVKKSTTLSTAITSGTAYSTITLADASTFPASGYILIDRDTDARERVRYTAKSGNVLTLQSYTATASHSSGASVILSQQGVDRTVPSGTVVSSPATSEQDEVRFVTAGAATLKDGDVYSSNATIQSVGAGTSQNVSAGSVSSISSPPWPTCTVTNALPVTGGRDLESDDVLRNRIRLRVQTASRGTAVALEQAALGVTSGLATCRRVQLVESLDGSPSTLYIHDGSPETDLTTFVSTSKVEDFEVIVAHATAGQRRGRLQNWPVKPETLKLYRAATGTSADQHGFGVATTTVGVTLTDPGKNWGANVWQGCYLIDYNKQKFLITGNTSTAVTVQSGTPTAGPYGIFDPSGANGCAVTSAEYLINLSSGELELVSAASLLENQWLIAWDTAGLEAYSYYTGLVAEVQKVLNGDPEDGVNYPGYKAFGVRVYVAPPSVISSQLVKVAISVDSSSVETAALRDEVKNAISGYISDLGIGETLVISELIARCQQVPGVYDTQIVTPLANVQVLPGQLFRASSIVVQ